MTRCYGKNHIYNKTEACHNIKTYTSFSGLKISSPKVILARSLERPEENMKKTYIGGQAIIEGVMMRGRKVCAMAVWSSKTEITIEKMPVSDLPNRVKLFKLPIFRGMAAFFDSLITGTKILNRSAEIAWDAVEEEEPSEFEKKMEKLFGAKFSDIMIYISVVISLMIGIALFVALPVFVGNLFKPYLPGQWLLGVIEGLIRLAIFMIYLTIISHMKEVKRLFKYHGAEHKTINCFEAGDPLTVENVRKHSREHRRCGTSFLFFVVIVSIIVGLFIRVDTLWLRILIRLLLLPVVSGLSYEILRAAGKSDAGWIRILSAPGLLCQRLTVKEPDDSMIECAIASVNAVFDWRQWQEENFGDHDAS